MVVFNPVKHKIGWYVEQARDTSADIVAILLKASGLQTDGAITDHATLAALLAAANDEADFANYQRLTCANPTVTVDTSGDRVLLKVDSPLTWPAAGAGNALGGILYVFYPSGGGTESTRLPLSLSRITATTDGNDLVVTLHTDGFARARNAT